MALPVARAIERCILLVAGYLSPVCMPPGVTNQYTLSPLICSTGETEMNFLQCFGAVVGCGKGHPACNCKSCCSSSTTVPLETRISTCKLLYRVYVRVLMQRSCQVRSRVVLYLHIYYNIYIVTSAKRRKK